MRLVFASPSYGPLDPKAVRSQRAAIMHAAGSGAVTWVGDMSPDRIGWESSRNTVVQTVINGPDPVDAIFWCDTDVTLPVHAITELVLSDRDFVTGLYFQRTAPHFPLVAQYDRHANVFHFLREWPARIIGPVDGCGFGCVLTSTAMLKAMTPPWFAFKKFSEDFDFCLNAKRAGYQLWMNTDVLCGHIPDATPVVADDFYRIRDNGELDAYIRKSSAA